MVEIYLRSTFHNAYKNLYLQTKMQRPFDQNADDFTLEKIIEFGFDQYAEAINEISGAATKELAIEQVQTKFVHGIIDISTIRLSDHLKWHYYDKRWELTLRQNVQHHLGQSEDWIFCVSLVMHVCNVWRNTLFRICWYNGCHFKHSVNT